MSFKPLLGPALALLLLASAAAAQTPAPDQQTEDKQVQGQQAEEKKPKSTNRRGGTSSPILFSADEMQTDEDLGLVVAKGHVQISQDLRTLLADVVTYNQRTDTITASGHVSLQEATGEVVFADFMELSDRYNQGFMQDLRLLLTDRTRMAGNTARRTGGNRLELRRGVYSPCDLCKEDPTRPPLWQLRGEKVVHDSETHKIEYYDAVMEVGGIPVFYTPYMSHPDPTIKRQSGFLFPTFGGSRTLGTHATIPYYWAIADDRDLTFSPVFTTSEGQVAAGDYRQRFSNGILDLALSVNDGFDPNNPTNSAIRGHVDAFGRWNLDEHWRTGFDLKRESDQTYERVFHYGGTENFLTSRAFAEDFNRRSYLAINAYSFQTLRIHTSDSDQPQIAPQVSYNWVGAPDRFGARWGVDADFLDLNRLRGSGSHRVSVGTSWTLPFKGGIGDVFTLTASTRGDVYQASDFAITPNEPGQNVFADRVFPQAALEWRYPWVRRGEGATQFIEPVTMLVVGPKGGNPARIPNEDSLAFDFNDTELFQPNRFAGLDRVDGGDRVDYGLRAAWYDDSVGTSSMLIGQSYRLQNNGGFVAGSGLENKRSDIVGRFIFAPEGTFDLVYRYRLAEQDLRPVRHEVNLSFGPPKLRTSISYVRLPPDLVSNDLQRRDQFSIGLVAGLSRYWTISLATTKNLTGELGTVSSSVIAAYQDECLAFIAQLSQTGFSDRDIKPGASLVFSVVFKGLGEVTAPGIALQGGLQ